MAGVRNKHYNPEIRELGKIIGDTQQQFARRVGYSEEFIYSVERGRCGVSEQFLEKVTHATGAIIHIGLSLAERYIRVTRNGKTVRHSFVKFAV
jgi:transcriptional regulator with XRE-family HTH domain